MSRPAIMRTSISFAMNDTVMTGNPRHDELLQLVNETGYVSVEELAERLSVSTQTIRRDIKKLSDDKLLVRHHGGAGRSSSVVNLDYNVRQSTQTQEKEAIGQKIADYVHDNSTIFLTIGTTTEIIAKHLLQKSGLRIITNSINVAAILYSKPDFDVMITGGMLQAHNGGVIGPTVTEFVKKFRVDYLITSCGSVEEDGALLDYDFSEVAVVQTVMSNARNILIAADSTKWNTSAAIELGNLKEMSALFTDTVPSKPTRSLLEANDVELHICLP